MSSNVMECLCNDLTGSGQKKSTPRKRSGSTLFSRAAFNLQKAIPDTLEVARPDRPCNAQAYRPACGYHQNEP